MEFKMTLLGSLLLFSMCLPPTFGDYNYGIAPSSYYTPPPPPPAYNPPVYSPPPPVYNPPPVYSPPPVYYETEETKVDFREANNTRRCGVQPVVHRHGIPKDETTFGEYPWVVAVLDTYQVYKCSGVLITPRHVLTAGNCVSGLNADDIVVRVGDYDIQTDRNYLEVYKNYEIPVCKKHFYYSVPEYGYAAQPQQQYGYQPDNDDDVYDAIILELNEAVDMDAYPQVEPICLPEFYYRSKEYLKEYYNSYGKSIPSPENDKIPVNKEGSSQDLECWVVGYSYSPSAEIKYQTATTTYTTQTYTVPAPPPPPPSYGYNYAPPPYYPPQTYTKYVPAYSYESYTENSLTPRRAKVHKVYEEEYQPPPPPPPTYGYNPPPTYTSAPEAKKDLYEKWEADYYFDTCRADVGSAIMCKVPGKYEDEDNGKGYENYVPEYSNPPPVYSPPPYQPSYSPPPPVYSPPPYQQQPSYQQQSSYSAPPPQPSYNQSPRYRREANYYYTPSPAPQYQSYSPPPPPPQYDSYSPPPPVYTPPQQQYSAPQDQYTPPAASPYSDSSYQINPAEAHNEEYRRFAVFGIVQYPTTCSSDSYESKKLQVTPIEEILPWILNVIHTPASQCSKYQAPPSPPSYDYQSPVYSTPMYDYQPPVYSPQVYSPPPQPSYNPPPPSSYYQPQQTYAPPAPPSYYY